MNHPDLAVAAVAGRGVHVPARDLFSIGIGPSSSHTVGPMRAAAAFVAELDQVDGVDRIVCRLQGSHAATGIGHGTPDAVLAGLRGLAPETCDPADVHGRWAELVAGGRVAAGPATMGRDDVVLDSARHHGHPNALTLIGYSRGRELLSRTYLSVGGGFVIRVGEVVAERPPVASGYRSARELLAECGPGRSIADVAFTDESALHGPQTALAGIDAIWAAMRASIEQGLRTEGTLPGGLRVRRRAAAAHRQFDERGIPPDAEERLAVYAMAVNEENAAGRRVVTAPTNGAAGVVPAVLYHHVTSTGAGQDDARTFLLTATAIGSLIKANASISGAEAGCQGEVGSACAMAAGGLCAVQGGTPAQVENAAEIAMEHHLGLTCDPVGGLVQIPCIERNAVAASTAVTAARIALLGDGTHVVSLDAVIETMRQTGNDMSSRYKETSEAGLAVNVVEC